MTLRRKNPILRSMDTHLDSELISAIETVLVDCNITQSQFGLAAVNDANLLTQLREGRELRRSTRAKVTACIEHMKQTPAIAGQAA